MSQVHSDDLLPGELEDQTINGSDDSYEAGGEREDRYWLAKARSAFDSSDDFLNGGLRNEWEDSLDRFHSQHPKGSKYHSATYKKRSKIFRPKTRSAARRAEATAAKALFSNSDLIDVRGQNTGSAVQAASARVNKELMQYRLEHSIPWFVTSMGARQDAFNYGVCCSLSTWEYKERVNTQIVPAMDEMGAPILDEEGREMGEEVQETVVESDKPIITLIPPENLRVDANADWRNPIADSPAITIMTPMYAWEVLQKMQIPNPVTGEAEWREYSLADILGNSQEQDTTQSTRQARQGDERLDPQDTSRYDEYTQVWVHLNILRDEDGADMCFYTLSNRIMLTDPVPVEEILPLGRESITVGISIIESHRVYPIGGNKLGAPLQSEINSVANQRMDNVMLALNKRFILKRGANVDQQALMRSVPGGGVTAGDPDKDIRVMEYNDVTSSSYQEHDRLSQEQDELIGTFSGSSVQANRALNETVGGMGMLKGDAASVAEYELRTWIETWVEPVLRKLQRLEAMFETDETILQIAGENSEVFQQYGQDVAIDNLLDHELSVSVNVGMGNTDPMQRVQQFSSVLGAAAQIPEVASRMKGDEVGKEMFALGGYSEGERFFMSEEEFQQAQEQAAAQQAQQAPQAPDTSLEVAQIKAQTEREIEQLRSDDRRYEAQIKRETAMEEMAAKMDIEIKTLYEKIGIDRAKLQDARDITALKEGNKSREMNLKRQMGSGI